MKAQLSENVDPSIELMDDVWRAVALRISAYRRDVSGLSVAPQIRLPALRQSLESMNFEEPRDWEEVLSWVDAHMRR